MDCATLTGQWERESNSHRERERSESESVSASERGRDRRTDRHFARQTASQPGRQTEKGDVSDITTCERMSNSAVPLSHSAPLAPDSGTGSSGASKAGVRVIFLRKFWTVG